MTKTFLAAMIVSATSLPALAQQAPWAAPDVAISSSDRIYAAEQFSNTVSVTDPLENKLLGVIKLGDPQPLNFSPLYKGQLLVHGLGISPDGATLAVVSVGSNSVTFIDTETNAVKHTTYIGRSPHEAFYSPDGKEVWVTVRGEDYVSVLNAETFIETTRVKTAGGPGMTIFSPDGQFAYVCSSFNPVLTVFEVRSRTVVGSLEQPSPFCPNIAASPDGRQIWYTLKDSGKVVAFDAKPPFATLKVLDTGPITNHVNFAYTPAGQFAYVSVGGLNQVKVFRTSDFSQVATIAVGKLPHGVWPSGDGTRIYVGLENADQLAVIDTSSNHVVGTVSIGQAPQAIVYVPRARRGKASEQNLQPLSADGAVQFTLRSVETNGLPTSVSLFDQGYVQILQAAVAGLRPNEPYVLALASTATGGGVVEPIASFKTNSAGAAIVNATGPIRQIVGHDAASRRRWLVIAQAQHDKASGFKVLQIQSNH